MGRYLSLREAAHLLRRAAARGTKAQAEQLAGQSLEAAADSLLSTPAQPKAFTTTLPTNERHRQYLELGSHWLSWWLQSPTPAAERMVLFWQGHFTSEQRVVLNPYAMAYQSNTFRRQGFNSLQNLLFAIARDPAMLRYLDNAYSHKNHPNENWSRELMELFTIGVGQYSESDVWEAARAFTGWSTLSSSRNEAQIEFYFRQDWHYPAPKKFMGHTVHSGDEVLEILLQHPQTYARLAKKVLEFYLMPNPPQAMQQEATRLLRSWGLGETLRWLFSRETFYGPQARNALIKSPIEYLVGLQYATGKRSISLGSYFNALSAMGQLPYNPPSVKGWEGGQGWLGETAMLTRLNLVAELSAQQKNLDLSVFMDGATGYASLVKPEAQLL